MSHEIRTPMNAIIGLDNIALRDPDLPASTRDQLEKMPVMNGLEATRAIRSLDRADAKEIPIIAMTANAFDEDVQTSLQAGMDAHLSKPVEPERLYETLGQLIHRT